MTFTRGDSNYLISVGDVTIDIERALREVTHLMGNANRNSA